MYNWFHKDPRRSLISVFTHVVIGTARIRKPLTPHPHVPLLRPPVAQSLPVPGKHTHTFCTCAILKFMGQFLYCRPAVLCHSGSLDLPTENCLGAHRAVSSSTGAPKYAPGKRLREHQKRETGNRDDSCSQMLPHAVELRRGGTIVPISS